MTERKGSITEKVIQFSRFLRKHEFNLGPQEEVDAITALLYIPIGHPGQFKRVLKVVFAKNKEQFARFDQLYFQFWKDMGLAEDAKIRDEKNPRASTKQSPPSLEQLKAWLFNKTSEKKDAALYSDFEVNKKKDLSLLSPIRVDNQRLLDLIIKRAHPKTSRRFKITRRHGSLDLRSVLRSNWQYNPDVVHLLYQSRKKQKKQIIVCCDVSKSMDLHNERMLHFIHQLTLQKFGVEVFLFSTSLERVTKAINERDFKCAVEHVTNQVSGWSGGTRIGFCLNELVKDYNRFIHAKSTLIIISDGWDNGELSLLEDTLSRIKRNIHGLIWINPLAGYANFKPKVRGMKIALSFIDVFTSFDGNI